MAIIGNNTTKDKNIDAFNNIIANDIIGDGVLTFKHSVISIPNYIQVDGKVTYLNIYPDSIGLSINANYTPFETLNRPFPVRVQNGTSYIDVSLNFDLILDPTDDRFKTNSEIIKALRESVYISKNKGKSAKVTILRIGSLELEGFVNNVGFTLEKPLSDHSIDSIYMLCKVTMGMSAYRWNGGIDANVKS